MVNKRVAFTTLGCKVNLYDTEAMIELFKEDKFEVVDFEDFADIYVINTCTVTNFGDKKSRQMIRRAKKQNPNSIIVAAGCYSQVAPEEVEKIYGVNIIIGNKDRANIVNLIKNYKSSNKVSNNVKNIMNEKTFEPLSIKSFKNRTRAYLKIQEGCNKFCTYCIIPYSRGPVRSRKPEEVIFEVKRLAKNGFKEIVLTGIHILAYGVDIKNTNLTDIIQKVHEIDGIERIRFSSIEPLVITDKFIEIMKNLPKVCDHYHLSLQSGCNKTLKNMNRHYTKEQYEIAVNKLRNTFKNVAITTDIIVGFPDETQEDFEESLNFVKKMKISKIHSFPYSPKKGTKAATFENQILNSVKAKRNREMISLGKTINIEFLNRFLNTEMLVLFEKKLDEKTYEGHTTNYIKIIVNSSENIINQILNVKLTEIIKENSMFGILV